jgi:hypothetical protein
MGVWGLLSFCQMANPPIGQQMLLSDIARKGATLKHQSPGSSLAKAPVLILDGYALAHHLFFRAEQCCWWDGGEMRNYAQCVRNWVRDVQACGLQLCCILDGMLEQRKEATAVQRVSMPPRNRSIYKAGWTQYKEFFRVRKRVCLHSRCARRGNREVAIHNKSVMIKCSEKEMYAHTHTHTHTHKSRTHYEYMHAYISEHILRRPKIASAQWKLH